MNSRSIALRTKHYRHKKFQESPLDRQDFTTLFDLLRDLEVALYDKKIIPSVHWRHLSIKQDRHLLHNETPLSDSEIDSLFDFLDQMEQQLSDG